METPEFNAGVKLDGITSNPEGSINPVYCANNMKTNISFERSLITLISPLQIVMYQLIPKPPIPTPREIPGYLTCIKLLTVGNLTQNEARPVGHLTFVSKCLSVVGSKMIFQFFDSACEPRSRVIALVDSTWVFLLLSFYIVISWNMPLFKVWSEDKLNKKIVVAENFAELVSTVALACVEGGGCDPI